MRKILTAICFLTGLTVFAQPVITSFNPSSGASGQTVTINGSGFNTSAKPRSTGTSA